MVTREVIGGPAYSYEGISDPFLKIFLEQRVEQTIQQVIEWPIQTSRVCVEFSGAFGLSRLQLFNIILAVGREQEGEGNRVRYSFGQDEVRIIGAFSWEFTERRGKRTLLAERIGRVTEALGDHPLRGKLNLFLLPLPIVQEEIVIEKPSLISVPHMDEGELKAGESWTLKELEELLSHIPEGWEDVNYPRILYAVDGHPYTHARSQQIMFIGAAWARDPQELRLLDKILEDLNNDQLRKGVRRCIVMLKRRPDIKNLTELFQKSVMRVQSRQQTAHDSSN